MTIALARRIGLTVSGFGLLAVAAILTSPLIGSTHISLRRAFDRGIPFADNVDAQIFFIARLPRTLAGALVGSLLASAGVVFQGLLRNPLATPFTLGVSAGAALGAMLAITFSWSLASAGVSAAAPFEAPTSIEPETGTSGRADGVEGGLGDGVDGIGDTASSVGGTGGGSAGPVGGPLRIGGTIGPPRKIKDAKPSYPQIAVFQQARGTIVIDITIGTDGKVQDARIVQSVPLLDQAALEAVRQWEYEPTRVDGFLVTVVMTVIVNFSIQ